MLLNNLYAQVEFMRSELMDENKFISSLSQKILSLVDTNPALQKIGLR